MFQNNAKNTINSYNDDQSYLHKKVQNFKAGIRFSFHQEYFQRIRKQLLNQQNAKQIKTNLCPKQQQNYSIMLNDKQQLYPSQQLTTNNSQKIQTQPVYQPNFDNINTFTSLSQLANLYNWLHNGNYRLSQKFQPFILHNIINKVLQQLQSKLICLKSIYSMTENRNNFHPSQTYNQNCNILFMLVIIYRELENLLSQVEQEEKMQKSQGQCYNSKENGKLVGFYRKKLMQICHGSNVLDRHMMGMLGINNKAIQY